MTAHAGGSGGWLPTTTPRIVSAAVMPVRLRTDLPREVAIEYWATRHRDIVRRLPQVVEYTQHHFSQTDHGYWPATDMVGTIIPPRGRSTGWPRPPCPASYGPCGSRVTCGRSTSTSRCPSRP